MLVVYALTSLPSLLSLFPHQRILAFLLQPRFALGASIQGRDRSPPHGLCELRFPPLYNLRRKYIQDISFQPKGALKRSETGTRGIHLSEWRHCGKGLDCSGQGRHCGTGCAALHSCLSVDRALCGEGGREGGGVTCVLSDTISHSECA